MNIKLIILAIAFCAGIGILIQSHLGIDTVPNSEQNLDVNSSSHFVSQDFFTLNKEKKLPIVFGDLKNINLTYHDTNLKKIIPKDAIPFKTHKSGRYKLDIEAFSAPDDKSTIIVLQMNVIDTKTGNKIFELSRNYEVQKKEKPD